jgi:hypothetical protein
MDNGTQGNMAMNVKSNRDQVQDLLLRAIDIDQVALVEIEALKHRFPYDIGLAINLERILRNIMANGELLRELQTKTLCQGVLPDSEEGDSFSSSMSLVAGTRNRNGYQR